MFRKKTAVYIQLLIFLLCFTLTGCFGGKPSVANVKIPESGVYNGMFIPYAPDSIGNVQMIQKDVEKTFSVLMFYKSFNDEFPEQAVKNAVENGSIPHITWEPWILSKSGEMNDLLQGKYDGQISKWVEGVKRVKYPLFIRLGHEMNGNWYPWSGTKNNNDPQIYIKFYKYIVDKFKGAKVDNVSWVWCPNCSSVPDEEWNEYSRYYPGDDYVDWLGIDGYNWGTSQSWSQWQSFDDIFGSFYEDMVSKYPNKPIMIGEFASTPKGGDKAKWIMEAYKAIKEKYPSIKAVMWFNINKETDWRVDSSDESLKAYKEAIKDSYFIDRYVFDKE